MDHSLLAGGFCTLATVLLAAETALAKNKNLSTRFISFYALGCIVWALLGAVTDQVPLFMIGMVQFLALISAYFFSHKLKEKHETS